MLFLHMCRKFSTNMVSRVINVYFLYLRLNCYLVHKICEFKAAVKSKNVPFGFRCMKRRIGVDSQKTTVAVGSGDFQNIGLLLSSNLDKDRAVLVTLLH
jgi:hypothetical protein